MAVEPAGFFFGDVFEDAYDLAHAAGGAGDLGGGVGFSPGDEPHEVDDAVLGDDFDMVGGEGARILLQENPEQLLGNKPDLIEAPYAIPVKKRDWSDKLRGLWRKQAIGK